MNRFIKQITTISIVIFTLVSIMPSNVYATQMAEKTIILNSKDDCEKTKDPNAPCRGEVFQTETLTRSTTKSVTCGVNVYTATGTKVATISETISFTTGTSTLYYTINSATRSTWVKNSSYSWRNLNGPTPGGGRQASYIIDSPSTYGDLHFLGSYWNTWRTTLVVSSASSWYCR